MKKRERPGKIEYYLGIAKAVSQRATCLRRIFGAILVVDDEIVSTGYCGSPRGAKNCIDEGCCFREQFKIPSGERYELCKSVHAEQNVLISVARKDSMGGIMYMFGEDVVGKDSRFRVEPCILCKRILINGGIKLVYTMNPAGDILKFHAEDWLENESFMLYGKQEEKDAGS